MIEWQQLKEGWLTPIGGALLLPYVVFREIKDQVDLWKTKPHTPLVGKGNQSKELKKLFGRLESYRDEASVRQERLCKGIIAKLFTDPSSGIALASTKLLTDIIWYEGFFKGT